jgi:FtsH-binding integral membrane protein
VIIGALTAVRVSYDAAQVPVTAGVTCYFAFLALLALSRKEERWVKVRTALKTGLAVLVIGTILVSVGSLENLFFSSKSLGMTFAFVGLSTFLVGIIIESSSLILPRRKPGTST